MTDASLSAKVTADIGDFVKKFDEMRGSIDKLGSGVSVPAAKAAESIGQIKQEIATVGNLLKSGALIQGGRLVTDMVTVPLIGLGREAVMLADKLRQSEIAFTTMLGSAEKASSFLRDLQAFAAATPFEFPELVQSAKKMMALGFTADQVIPNLRAVGDAVAGLGGNAGTFDRIILALGQMQAKGQVMSGEMRQLAEAGIPAWDILAQKLGVTIPEAMDMVSKKAVDGATGVAALMEGMGQRFGGLMEQQSQTIQGTLANLHDTVNFIMTDIGRELIETLKIREGLAAVQEFAKGFLSWFKQLDDGTKQVLLVFAGVFAIGGPILVAVGAFMAAMAVITAPILAAGAIVAGIIAGVTLILLNWQKIKDTGTALWTGVKDSVVGSARAIYEGIVEWLVTKTTAIAAKVQSVATSFAKPFEWLADHLVGHSVIPDMVEDIGRHMQNLDVAMTAPARTATVATAKIFEGMQFTVQSAMDQVISTINFSWGSAVQTVSNALAQMTAKQVEWSQVGTQIGLQFLGAMINQVLQLMTQWALAALFGQAVWDTMETAKTVMTATQEKVRLGIMNSANKAAMAATIGTLISMAAVGNAMLAIAAVAITVTNAALTATGIALQSTPFTAPAGQQMMGAAIVAQSIGMSAVGTGLAKLNVAIGGAIVAAGAAMAAIPAFATGGAVFGPTLALVGENATRSNPEYIGHANQLGLTGGGGPTTIILEMNGRQFGKVVVPYLHGPMRRQAIGA